jgi:hypothetical protein
MKRTPLLLAAAVLAGAAAVRMLPSLARSPRGAIFPSASTRAADAATPAESGSETLGGIVGGTGPADAASRFSEMETSRKLIRNAEISLEVARFSESVRRAEEIARIFGGYVADSQAGGEGEQRTGTLVVRVRSDDFDRALAALRSLGNVRTEHVGMQDVTRAYADLETRLRVQREAADRVRGLLRNRAAKLSEILAAEKELSRLIEQIESLEGERLWYGRQIALSSISVELREPESASRPSAFEPLREALRDSMAILSRSLAAFLVGFLYVLPWGVLIGILAALLRRARARLRPPLGAWPGPAASLDEAAPATGRFPGGGEKTKR